MDYCAFPVPAAITEALGAKGPVLGLAHVNNSESFRVCLFPVGDGKHYIWIKAKVRQETKIKTGDRVRVRITVQDRADVAVPDDPMTALRANGATQAFHLLPPGKKNFVIRRMDEAVKPETRKKRVQKVVEAALKRSAKVVDAPK